MVVALRSAGTRAAFANTPGVPAGTTTADVVVIACAGNCTVASSVPTSTGFTLAGIIYSGASIGRYIALLVKQAAGPESGTYTIVASGLNVHTAQAFAFTGATLTGIAVTSATDAASSATTPGVTGTATAGDYTLLSVSSSGATVTLTSVPAGWAEISDTSAAIGHTVGQAAPGGSTGSVSVVMNTSQTNRTAIMLNVPAGSAPPSLTEDVIVGGAKKTVTTHSVIVGGTKKTVASASVIVGGAKKTLA